MRLNKSLNEFKKNHLRKKNQIIFRSLHCKNYYKVENLYKFLLSLWKKELQEEDIQL